MLPKAETLARIEADPKHPYHDHPASWWKQNRLLDQMARDRLTPAEWRDLGKRQAMRAAVHAQYFSE